MVAAQVRHLSVQPVPPQHDWPKWPHAWQVPPKQVRVDPHAEPAQQGWPAPPHAAQPDAPHTCPAAHWAPSATHAPPAVQQPPLQAVWFAAPQALPHPWVLVLQLLFAGQSVGTAQLQDVPAEQTLPALLTLQSRQT